MGKDPDKVSIYDRVKPPVFLIFTFVQMDVCLIMIAYVFLLFLKENQTIHIIKLIDTKTCDYIL